MPSNPEAKFRSDALSTMSSHAESVTLRLDALEKATTANTRAIAQLTAAIDKQSQNISDQGAAIDRLERAVDRVVIGIETQSQTMQDFLALATRQAAIIENLTGGKAA